MTNILVSNCIFTFDKINHTTCILSTNKKDKIIFPTFRVESAKNLYNEIKYNVKNMFDDSRLIFTNDIIVSSIDIHNELYLSYLKEIDNKDYSESTDIVILSSILLAEKYHTQLFWKNYDHHIDFSQKDIFGLLIDHIIKNTVI